MLTAKENDGISEHNNDNTMNLVDDKTQQIVKILESDDITYGTAKTIIHRVEAEFIAKGNTFLSQTKFKNVSPLMFISRH